MQAIAIGAESLRMFGIEVYILADFHFFVNHFYASFLDILWDSTSVVVVVVFFGLKLYTIVIYIYI